MPQSKQTAARYLTAAGRQPLLGAHQGRMAAFIIGAVHNDASVPGLAHLPECYLFAVADHSTSFARVIAGDFGFLTLIQ